MLRESQTTAAVPILACGRFRRWLRARRLLLVFLDQAANSVGWLRATRDPIFSTIELQRAVVTGFLRIVRADDLDKFSVARAAFVCDDDLEIWAI